MRAAPAFTLFAGSAATSYTFLWHSLSPASARTMRNAGSPAPSGAAALLTLTLAAASADAMPVVAAVIPRMRLLLPSNALSDHQTTVINPRISDRDGLNGGEIAGIVIGSVAALLLLIGIIFLAFKLSKPAKAKKVECLDPCEGGTKTWGPLGGGWTSMWSFALPSAPPPPPRVPGHCPPHGGGGGHGHNPCPPGFVPVPCPPPRVAKPGSSIWRVPFRPPFVRGSGGDCCDSCGLAQCVCCVVCRVTPCRCMMGGMRCGTCRQGRDRCRCGSRGGRGGGRSAVTCKTCRMALCSCTDCGR